MRRAMSPAALAALAAAGLMVWGAVPVLAGDPIMPLSEVREGMTGEARTVVRGTDIVTFPVSVLDVQHAADAPGGALILGRAEGPLIESTGGVAQGMSGSPVYVTGADGVPRVIGAVAYGTGDQAGVVIGITPIEQMLQSASGRRAYSVRRVAASTSAPRRTLVRVADRAAARALERRHPARIAAYPLERWTLAGVSRPLAAPLTRALGRRGIALTTIGPRTERPRQELVPGATMSVLLAGGDLVLGSVGTVTYLDGTRVLGFGHPFVGGGSARFLMGDGYVYQTIAAPIQGASYKLAEPGVLQGAIVADRADGVTGTLGPDGGIPAVSRARDLTRDTDATVRAVLAPDERTLPLVAATLQTEAALRARDGIGGGTLRITLRITSPALARPLVYRNLFAAYGDVISPSSAELGRAVAMLSENGVRRVPISAISVHQTIERRVRAARLVSARAVPARVRAGQRVVLELRVAPWRAPRRVVRLRVRIPAGTEPGAQAIRVVPNTGLGFDPTPAALEGGLGETVVADRRADVAAVDRLAARLDGPPAQRVARSALRLLGGRNDAVRVLMPGDDQDSPTAGRAVGVDEVMYGPRAVARIRVIR